MSNPTPADYAAMLARLNRGVKPPFTTRTSQKEIGRGGIQDEIETWLRSLGTACYWVRSRTDMPTTNKVGTPDFCGCILVNGACHPFAIEVKRRGQKATIEQQGELMRCRLAGATVAVVHSLEEAQSALTGEPVICSDALWCAYCGKWGNHQSGSCLELTGETGNHRPNKID